MGAKGWFWKISTIKFKEMKKTISLLLVAMVGIVPYASAGWGASMKTTYKYDYTFELASEISIGSGSIGLGGVTASAKLSAIIKSCESALWYCNEGNESIIKF